MTEADPGSQGATVDVADAKLTVEEKVELERLQSKLGKGGKGSVARGRSLFDARHPKRGGQR